jgi:hypothetical protein
VIVGHAAQQTPAGAVDPAAARAAHAARGARAMAAFFALGSTCFLIGPFPGYASAVGDTADAITFFIGSILFTIGGALQSRLAWPGHAASAAGRAAWATAWIQSIGTLFFNVTTFQALSVAPTNGHYDRLVWRPDALGSICFLISGSILYVSSPRRGLWPRRGETGWWEPGVNLLGCVFFGISAVAGYLVPSTGSMLNLAAANWNTSLGAACFLAVALATLIAGSTHKLPDLHRLRALEHTVERDLEQIVD